MREKVSDLYEYTDIKRGEFTGDFHAIRNFGEKETQITAPGLSFPIESQLIRGPVFPLHHHVCFYICHSGEKMIPLLPCLPVFPHILIK